MPASPRPVASTIPGLTSLRFFAAFAVVLYHTLPPWTYPGWTFVWQVTRNGATGVSLFFVLSGFILFHVYREAIASGRFSTWDFLSARFARIYPVYVIGLVLALPGSDSGPGIPFTSAPITNRQRSRRRFSSKRGFPIRPATGTAPDGP